MTESIKKPEVSNAWMSKFLIGQYAGIDDKIEITGAKARVFCLITVPVFIAMVILTSLYYSLWSCELASITYSPTQEYSSVEKVFEEDSNHFCMLTQSLNGWQIGPQLCCATDNPSYSIMPNVDEFTIVTTEAQGQYCQDTYGTSGVQYGLCNSPFTSYNAFTVEVECSIKSTFDEKLSKDSLRCSIAGADEIENVYRITDPYAFDCDLANAVKWDNEDDWADLQHTIRTLTYATCPNAFSAMIISIQAISLGMMVLIVFLLFCLGLIKIREWRIVSTYEEVSLEESRNDSSLELNKVSIKC